MRYNLLIAAILLAGCSFMEMDNFYRDNVEESETQKIEREYNNIKFNDGIDQREAEIIFQKYILDHGWPWKLAGGNTRPTDFGENWLIRYMDDSGRIKDSEGSVLIDKASGEIEIRK